MTEVIKIYPEDKRNSIAIVLDNHQLFADSFGKMIQDLRIFREVNVFVDRASLLAFLIRVPSHTKCYFFLDYYLDENTVLPIISDIKRIVRSARIIIVSVATNPALLRNLAGHEKVDGVISKYSGTEDVVECIREVMNNRKFVAGYLQRIIDEDNAIAGIPLTDRELEIVQMAAQGMTVDLTAQKLNISRHTVAAHRRKILAKTGCSSISGLLVLARKMKWI